MRTLYTIYHFKNKLIPGLEMEIYSGPWRSRRDMYGDEALSVVELL